MGGSVEGGVRGGDSSAYSGGVDGASRPAPAMVKMPMGPPDQPSPAASLKYVRSYETTLYTLFYVTLFYVARTTLLCVTLYCQYDAY